MVMIVQLAHSHVSIRGLGREDRLYGFESNLDVQVSDWRSRMVLNEATQSEVWKSEFEPVTLMARGLNLADVDLGLPVVGMDLSVTAVLP